jgi:Zn-dependent peptidase ImmA (M78 family)
LAEAVGINQSTVARLESDHIALEDSHLSAISLRTGFPPSFFRQGPPPEFALGSLLFRKRKSLDRDDKARIRQLARLAFELAEKLGARTKVIDVTIKRFQGQVDPVRAARVTRDNLGLSPDTPVYKLMHTLEKNGVVILALPVEIPKYDAFSLWSDSDPRQPIIVLSANRTGDRIRFSLAHELAHLLMHHPVTVGNAIVEEEANRFASEFLLPEEAMRKEIILPLTLTHLAELKARWGVSMQALIMRALAMGLISSRQVKRLFMMLSARGWRTNEPVAIPAEKPRRLRKMAEVVLGGALDLPQLAVLIHAPTKLVREILESHAGREDLSSPVAAIGKSQPQRPQEPSKIIDIRQRQSRRLD